MSPGMLRRDISCRFIIIIIINQRGGGVAQRHTITALGNPPPIIWKFINGLRRYQKLKDTEIEGLIAGRNAAQRRPAYTNVRIGASETSCWTTRIVISLII